MSRRVIVTTNVRVPDERPGTYKMEKQEREAAFHQFGVGYVEFETGPGNYSTAIVEFDDGTVDDVPVSTIKFCDPLEGAQ